MQDELVWWLYHERGVEVSRQTVGRLLQRHKWSRKSLKRISLKRNEHLRRLYLDNIRHYAAEDLVFLDESIFNEKTGWRYHGYAPIGDEARLSADIQRGRTWSICSAMALDGWLPCTGIREGYFKADDFFEWVHGQLLPALDIKGQGRPMVVILDNVSIHINNSITEAVEAAGHVIHHLPPYSPDYNPIELTFSVLKAWMKRNWVFLRQSCRNYGEFLELSIRESHCDRYARKQFKHAGGEGVYIEEEEMIKFYRYIEDDNDPESY
jgi:transposase